MPHISLVFFAEVGYQRTSTSRADSEESPKEIPILRTNRHRFTSIHIDVGEPPIPIRPQPRVNPQVLLRKLLTDRFNRPHRQWECDPPTG